jgi:hypothetical protein
MEPKGIVHACQVFIVQSGDRPDELAGVENEAFLIALARRSGIPRVPLE